MSTYDYACDRCGYVEEQVHGMNEKPEFKCPECQGPMEKLFSPNIGGFILKGGTPAIHYREKQQRMKHSEEMAQRQKLRYGDSPGPKIKPNIAGHETGTWENAAQIAKEIAPVTGIDTKSYEKLAVKESPKKIVIARS